MKKIIKFRTRSNKKEKMLNWLFDYLMDDLINEFQDINEIKQKNREFNFDFYFILFIYDKMLECFLEEDFSVFIFFLEKRENFE